LEKAKVVENAVHDIDMDLLETFLQSQRLILEMIDLFKENDLDLRSL
jgi:hypothetical protein